MEKNVRSLPLDGTRRDAAYEQAHREQEDQDQRHARDRVSRHHLPPALDVLRVEFDQPRCQGQQGVVSDDDEG